MTTAADESAKDKLLAALRAYHGGNIYLMAPRGIIGDAFKSYHENPVTSIDWDADFSRLHVRMGGGVVTVLLHQDQPVFTCACPRGNNCRHIICAILTVKNLLMPEVFKPRNPDPGYRKALLAGLTGETAMPSIETQGERTRKHTGLSVVLERKHEDTAIDVYAAVNGKKITRLAELLRTPLAEYFLLGEHALQAQKIEALIKYLKRHPNAYPVIVRRGEEEAEATFDPEASYRTFTVFSLSGDRLSVIKGLRDDAKREVSFELFGDLIWLPDAGKLTVLEDETGWQVWDAVRWELFDTGLDDLDDYGKKSFIVPIEVFNSLELLRISEEDDQDVRFTVNGGETRPEEARIDYRITIEEERKPEQQAVLRVECRDRGYAFHPDQRRFRFFEDINNRVSPYLRTKKRKAALVSAFFKITRAASQDEAGPIIRAALNDGEIVKRDMRNEASHLLWGCWEDGMVSRERMLARDGEWRYVRSNDVKGTAAYQILFDLFGWELFDGIDHASALPVPSDRLFERLDLLRERLSQAGIGLFLRGKPVAKTVWEVSIDATRRMDIDWFEIKPEIRCDGTVMDELSREAIVMQRGMLEKEDCIQVLDSNTRQILDRIAAISGAADRADGREREIVRIPRLQILDWLAFRGSGVRVNLPPEDEELLERLLHFERIERKPLPKNLSAKLRTYQQDGYTWLSFLYEHRFGACLADDMGLGKTVQAITLLGGISEGLVKPPARDASGPHLIVVPPSLLFNWEHEIGKFYPSLKVHLYSGYERSADFAGHDVVLTTYGTVRRDIELLETLSFNVIIFDEAQAVKNIHADTTGAVRRLKGVFKLAMTGTPLENHLGEYYSIIDLALPGLIGEYDAFRPLMKSDASPALDRLIHRTKPFVLRRTKGAVLKDLPPKSESDIYLELTEQQKALYQKTVERVRSTIDDAYRTKTQAQARIIALTAILKLRQICISPQLVAPELSGISPKMDFLIGKLRELMEENHSALVFSQFTSFLDILGHALETKGIRFLRLDGSTPTAKRKSLVNQFQSGEGPSVFLLSLKAGGQGLNLTKASYVFHLDPWWNPAVEDQASDRAHRIGQRNKVTITRLLMQHTIEEKMMELKKRKRALYEAIMNNEAGVKSGLSITPSDFAFLLG